MTSAVKHFGDRTHWNGDPQDHGAGGWYPPGSGDFIRPYDPCWGRVLDQARKAYGDPNIHFDTDEPQLDRHLVFGDGTRLPEDGSVVYHDAGTKQNWAQNEDGTVSPIGADGRQGAPIAPAGFRKIGDQYAPVNGTGQQVAPQLAGVPSSDNGFHTDSKTGVLTPKNAHGDYYALGPDGKRSFFDKDGKPITEQQFDDASEPRGPTAAAPDAGLPTGEQQSGEAADAVKKLQDDLKEHFTAISSAEEKLSEVLLNAHATSADGQGKLNDIQKKIVDAVHNPTMDVTTVAGEKSYLIFLRNQVSAIQDLLASGALSAEDQSKAAQALATLYAADNASPGRGDDSGTTDQPPPAPAPAPAGPTGDPGSTEDPGSTDPGLGPAPEMPDPSLSDVLGPMGMPMGSDPMSSLASMLPGALGGLSGLGGGGLGGGGGSPLDGLSGLAGAAGPLAGLASQLGDQGSHDHPSDTTDKSQDDKTDPAKADKSDPAKADATSSQNGNPQRPAGQDPQDPAAGGGPPAPITPPTPASAAVKLPDGSIANARNPQAAQAVRDYLAGGTVDSSYRQNGITLPPPGTPVTDPVDPSRLSCGDVAMFKDHYEPVLSSVKGYLNGQVVPLSSVTSSPDFLGFIDPTAAAAAGSAPTPVVPPAPPAAAAAPLSAPSLPDGVVAPVPTG
jgi:hypothetical protein